MKAAPSSDRLFFDKLSQRHRLAGVLTTRTALHIGSGSPHWESASDLPVLRDAAGEPYVPGSSVKGVVRSTVEALLRGAARAGERLWPCDPLGGSACGRHGTGGRAQAVAEIAEKHCPVCRVFGSTLLASHVRISDALIAEGSRARVEVRDGVAIDRDLRTVYGAQKYDFEVVAPGAGFALEVFVDNPEDWSMGLLLMGFEQLHAGFTALGGFGSRGLGRVEIRWDSLTTCTAAQLIAGDETVLTRGEALDNQIQAWRAALGRWAQGEA